MSATDGISVSEMVSHLAMCHSNMKLHAMHRIACSRVCVWQTGVDSLTQLVMLRHHDVRVGGLIPGLGVSTLLQANTTMAIPGRVRG